MEALPEGVWNGWAGLDSEKWDARKTGTCGEQGKQQQGGGGIISMKALWKGAWLGPDHSNLGGQDQDQRLVVNALWPLA